MTKYTWLGFDQDADNPSGRCCSESVHIMLDHLGLQWTYLSHEHGLVPFQETHMYPFFFVGDTFADVCSLKKMAFWKQWRLWFLASACWRCLHVGQLRHPVCQALLLACVCIHLQCNISSQTVLGLFFFISFIL